MNQPRKDENIIVRHSRRELRLAHMFETNGDYDGVIGKGVLTTIKTLVRYSRGDIEALNAMVMTINELMRGELLSPPSDDPNEWREMDGAKPMIWQNKRSPYFRSKDAGKTWFHMKDELHEHSSMNHLTGEVPEDAPIQENTNSGSDGEGVEGVAESTGKDSANESVPGSGIDAGVDSQGTEDSQSPEVTPDKPKDREAA